MRNRWNTREILSQSTDTLGLVIGLSFLAIITAFTVFVIITGY